MADGHNISESVTREATKWSLISSSGFILSAIVMSILFIFLQRKGRGQREPGSFAIFMILLELIDAIPEAAVIAQSAINRTIGWSFVISILMLNIVNTCASSIDFLATSDNKILHRVLFALLFFSVGMLCYSISTDVYGKFAELFTLEERHIGHMMSLMAGTLVGFSLIILLMKFEGKMHRSAEGENKEEEAVRNALEKINEQLQIIAPKIDTFFHKKGNSGPYLGPPSPSPLTLRRNVEDFSDIEEMNEEVKQVEVTDATIDALNERVNNLRELEILMSFLYSWGTDPKDQDKKSKLAIIEDFSTFLANKTMETIEKDQFIPKKN